MKHPATILVILFILASCTTAQPIATDSVIPTPTLPTALPTVGNTPHPGDALCILEEGYTPAEDNVYQVLVGETLWGTIEYKDGILRLFNEPGHYLAAERQVDGYQNPPFRTNVAIDNVQTNELVTTVHVIICAGALFTKQEDAPGPQITMIQPEIFTDFS